MSCSLLRCVLVAAVALGGGAGREYGLRQRQMGCFALVQHRLTNDDVSRLMERKASPVLLLRRLECDLFKKCMASVSPAQLENAFLNRARHALVLRDSAALHLLVVLEDQVLGERAIGAPLLQELLALLLAVPRYNDR